ncbi:MAG: ankyrin repeat domain-containing protein, partial [Synergistaceae bacterium]|nr:ankyrin repeat domain-containing protein [Synergistaceae bacterium]
MYAACNDHTETVKLLLKYHADVNARDNTGVTVLMYAA